MIPWVTCHLQSCFVQWSAIMHFLEMSLKDAHSSLLDKVLLLCEANNLLKSILTASRDSFIEGCCFQLIWKSYKLARVISTTLSLSTLGAWFYATSLTEYFIAQHQSFFYHIFIDFYNTATLSSCNCALVYKRSWKDNKIFFFFSYHIIVYHSIKGVCISFVYISQNDVNPKAVTKSQQL